MFNGLVTFPRSEVNIGDGGIVVQLVKVFCRSFADWMFAGQDPERSQRFFLSCLSVPTEFCARARDKSGKIVSDRPLSISIFAPAARLG